MKLIKLTCPACEASLEADIENRDILFCPYCGTKIMLDDESLNINLNYTDVAKAKETDFKRETYYRQRSIEELEYERTLQEYEKWKKNTYDPWRKNSILLSTIPLAVAILLQMFSEKMHLISQEGFIYNIGYSISALLWVGGFFSLIIGHFIMKGSNPMRKYEKKQERMRKEELYLREKQIEYEAKYSNSRYQGREYENTPVFTSSDNVLLKDELLSDDDDNDDDYYDDEEETEEQGILVPPEYTDNYDDDDDYDEEDSLIPEDLERFADVALHVADKVRGKIADWNGLCPYCGEPYEHKLWKKYCPNCHRFWS